MDYSGRLQRLRNLLQIFFCDALLIERPTDIFYLTGLELSSGKLIVSLQNACLIVDGRYYELSCQQTVYPVQLLKENVLEEWIRDSQVHQLGFDQHYTTYHNFLSLQRLKTALKTQFYELELLALESPVQRLRLIKDKDEVNELRRAAHLGYQGYEFVTSLLLEGVTESELALELEFFWKKRGAKCLAFEPIIAFGPHSSMPHYHTGHDKLTFPTSVLIDIGVVLAHYHSDMTRVIFLGKIHPIMETLYSIVEEAKARALALCKPGTLVGELDWAARDWITIKGYGDYFTHSLGHGIGLEIHEPPILRHTGIYQDMPLQEGMVITIEPGIYLPQVGGIRLEDTILITKNGYENLTISTSN